MVLYGKYYYCNEIIFTAHQPVVRPTRSGGQNDGGGGGVGDAMRCDVMRMRKDGRECGGKGCCAVQSNKLLYKTRLDGDEGRVSPTQSQFQQGLA